MEWLPLTLQCSNSSLLQSIGMCRNAQGHRSCDPVPTCVTLNCPQLETPVTCRLPECQKVSIPHFCLSNHHFTSHSCDKLSSQFSFSRMSFLPLKADNNGNSSDPDSVLKYVCRGVTWGTTLLERCHANKDFCFCQLDLHSTFLVHMPPSIQSIFSPKQNECLWLSAAVQMSGLITAWRYYKNSHWI